jgi:hypothetical protein
MDFDLNIDNYTIDELEDFFMLGRSSGIPIYDSTIVERKRDVLCRKLTGDPALPLELKVEIKAFLEQASDRINAYTRGAASGVSGMRLPGSGGGGGGGGNSVSVTQYNPNDNLFLPPVRPPQSASAAFATMQNTVVQQGQHFLIQNPSSIHNSTVGAASSSGTPASGSGGGGGPGDFSGSSSGVINPIYRRTVRRALNIDTRFRPSYASTKSTDIQLTLPYRFEKVVGFRVAAVEMPITYYAISAELGNNAFRVDWTDDLSEGLTAEQRKRSDVIVLPDGNYETSIDSSSDANLSTIETTINTLLRACSSGRDDGMLRLRFTVDRISGRSIFAQDISLSNSVIPPSPFTLTFNVDSLGRTIENAALPLFLGWSLGFRAGAYNSAGTASAAQASTSTAAMTVISEGICSIQGPRYAFIAIDDYNNNVNNYFISAYKDSVSSPNVVARINLNKLRQSENVYRIGQDDGISGQLDFRTRIYFGPVDIQKMRITVLDEFGRVLNLNNMDWSMALVFECMYE